VLPRFVEKNRWPIGAALLVAYALLYEVAGRIGGERAVVLPATALDHAFALVPWTVWIYASYPLVFLTGFAIEEDRDRLNRWLWANLAVNVASALVFVLAPTSIDRGPPPPAGASGALLAWIRSVDAPVNCLPSLHVSTSVLTALAARGRRKAWLGAWAAAIAVSTLTTRQHCVVDVIGGTLVAAGAWAAFRRAELRPSREPLGRPSTSRTRAPCTVHAR
jgi:membrane-associated phospholipid phosphatase